MKIRDIAKEVFKTKLQMSGIEFYIPDISDAIFDKLRDDDVILNLYNNKVE